jgi:hypothetical protein
MAVIRMLKTYASNVAGEVCGHPDDIASKLVSRGLAVYVTAAPVGAVTKAVETNVEEVFAEAEEEEQKGLFKKSRKKG